MVTATRNSIFHIGGEFRLHRMGFGAKRLTGSGVWGPLEDRRAAVCTSKPRATARG
jgi:pyridoxine 4-dehydrogenase